MTTIDLLQTGTLVLAVPIGLMLWLRVTVLENCLTELQREVLHERIISHLPDVARRAYDWEGTVS